MQNTWKHGQCDRDLCKGFEKHKVILGQELNNESFILTDKSL